MSTSFPLSIQHIERLTPSSVAISFDVPSEHAAAFSYVSGQYLSLETNINGKQVRRAYSLCSSPSEQSLTVGIKKVKEGVFSTFANERLSVGDTLNVFPPEGRFTYTAQENDHLFLVAAGSGITPIFSILKTALSESSSTTIDLLYGNKNPNETLFLEELKALEQKHAERLKIHWVYSQSNESEALFGRIDSGVVQFALNKLRRTPNDVFLCGPEGLIETAKESLLQKGIQEDKIHFELFTSAPASAPSESSSKGEVKLELLCDDENYSIKTTQAKTLLDAALQNKIDVPYSCQGGVCCSCIAKVTSGSAKMENNQILTDDEIEEGLVLTCQAFPASEHVKIDFDDV